MKTALVTPARAKTPRAPASARAGRKAVPQAVDPVQRHRMIAEAAFFRAEQRGFAEGSALQDWIEAEVEIDSMRQSPGSGD